MNTPVCSECGQEYSPYAVSGRGIIGLGLNPFRDYGPVCYPCMCAHSTYPKTREWAQKEALRRYG